MDTPHPDDKSVPGDTPDLKDTPIDYEAEARAMGWRPESEYKGDPKRFLDAQAFYENGVKVLPILREQNKALYKEIDRIKASTQEFAKVVERDKQRAIEELTQQLAEAKLARKEAVSQGDGDGFNKADSEVEKLEADLKATKSEVTPKVTKDGLDPEFMAWLETPRGQKYRDDHRLRSMANGLVFNADGTLSEEFKHLGGQGTKLYEAVMTKVEDIDAALRRTANGDLERPGPKGGGRGVDGAGSRERPSPRSYENLTKEFKAACDSMGRDFGYSEPEKLKKWREQYVNGCTDDAFRS